MKRVFTRSVGVLAVALAVFAVTLTGCSSSSDAHAKQHRHTEIYSADGHYYCRTHDDDGSFIWWLLVWNDAQSQPQISTQNARVSLSGASWQPTAAPAGRVGTGVAVGYDKAGQPATDEETESVADVEADGGGGGE